MGIKQLFLFVLSIGIVSKLDAQAKGASPILTSKSSTLYSSTYAVVIGISDYQNPSIPDLRYADKDAEVFANYLRSKAGGRLDEDHLKVLINQQATMAQFANALDWLWEVCKEGDQAIIYFSGHGDVEKKSLTQPGFLLCWDSPAHVYMAGGAFALPMLQEVISTLSIQNKAKVVVITDACHSGVLAGSSVGGAHATASNLAKQYANEVKIMSCQPNEYSIEGEQWGGGRGAFSFHLVEGLYGFADSNNDQLVTLQEMGRYLEDHVTNEVVPISQVPMIIGNRTERLASVDSELLSSIKSGKGNQNQLFSSIDSKGIEEEVLKGLDSSILVMYQHFKSALKDKKLLEPKNDCADFYYEQLAKVPELNRLHSTMRRNYAAVLQDESQQVMNNWIGMDIKQMSLSVKSRVNKYGVYPRYLERAMELLGSNHYMYKSLQSRKYFFEGYLSNLSNRNANKMEGQKAMALFDLSLQWQSDLPHLYWQKSLIYGYCYLQPDSAIFYARKAMELQPSWLLPCYTTAVLFSRIPKSIDNAVPFLEEAVSIDSNSVMVWQAYGDYWNLKNEFVKAEQCYKKAILADSIQSVPYLNISSLYQKLNRYDDAELMINKALTLDSTQPEVYGNYGLLLKKMKRFAESEIILKKSLKLDPLQSNVWGTLGLVYAILNQYEDAEMAFDRAIKNDSRNLNAQINMVCLLSIQMKKDKAFEYLNEAFKNGFHDYNGLQEDPDLSYLRSLPEWHALIAKYFPEKMK